MSIASSCRPHLCIPLLLVSVLAGCGALAEHAEEYFGTPTKITVNVAPVASEKALAGGSKTVVAGRRWEKAQIRIRGATATLYRLANHVYALQRVKVGVQSTTSYTKFLVAVPESYKTLFARRGRSSENANDAAPPYPVPIYAGILPAPSVRRVLPGDVRLLTSDVKFTMLRDGDVGIFGERDEPSLVFLYAPHCDPCDEDLQAIAHEARAMHRGGMSIYMVVPSGAGTASAENALRGLRVVDDIAIVPDRYGALFAYLQTNTMPRNYIFAREGTVAVARMGSFPDGELQHALARAGIDIAL